MSRVKMTKTQTVKKVMKKTGVTGVSIPFFPDPAFLNADFSGVDHNYTVPADFTYPPYAYPKNKPDQEKINEIISFSMHQQKLLSGDLVSGFITAVLHRCLTAAHIKHRVVSGFCRVLSDRAVPHMWLEIEGCIIDNTYCCNQTEGSLRYIKETYPNCYGETMFSQIHKSPVNDLFPESCKLDLSHERQLIIHMFMEDPDRGIALKLNKDFCREFYFTMIRHMYDKYEVTVQGIDPLVHYVCWRCGRYPNGAKEYLSDLLIKDPECVDCEKTDSYSWKFKKCYKCNLASYCSAKCQKLDWEEKHFLLCTER